MEHFAVVEKKSVEKSLNSALSSESLKALSIKYYLGIQTFFRQLKVWFPKTKFSSNFRQKQLKIRYKTDPISSVF